MNITDKKIGIIGLGYVGLPLAVEFGKKFGTIGFDVNSERIKELKLGIDSTLECTPEELNEAKQVVYSTDNKELTDCNIYIVTVPTPIDKHKQPDLTPLIKASEMLGEIIGKGILLSMSQQFILVPQKKNVSLLLSEFQVCLLIKISLLVILQSELTLVIKSIGLQTF